MRGKELTTGISLTARKNQTFLFRQSQKVIPFSHHSTESTISPNTMKFNILPISFASTVALCTVASASAWSCGPSQRVIRNRYTVGCRPNESCGPSSTDFLTLPEIEAMLRRGRIKQRDFYRPFLDEFQANMDAPFGTSPFPPWKTRSNKKSTPTSASPRYDIIETDSNIQIAIDVPGIEMNNINILLDDQTKVLTVGGSREQVTTSRNGVDDTSGLPTSSRTFSQKFVLKNPTIDINSISATLENGVLTITLPKIPPKEDVKEINVRQIPITSSKSATAIDDNNTIHDGDDPTDTESSVTDSVVAMPGVVEDKNESNDTLDNSNDTPSNSDDKDNKD